MGEGPTDKQCSMWIMLKEETQMSFDLSFCEKKKTFSQANPSCAALVTFWSEVKKKFYKVSTI